MAKTAPPSKRITVKSDTKTDSTPETEAIPPVSTFRSVRELVESLAIALILAFLFKSFLAEAFVIPTGSMAVTLMGAHKDVHCQKCGYRYPICASEEFVDGTATRSGAEVVGGTCPVCQFTMYFGQPDFSPSSHPRHAPEPTFTGDRILVNKCITDYKEPSRWDVTVFRYPGGPRDNYIKRLVGLENETIRIEHGDIFVRKLGQSDFKIVRKPSDNLLSMLQTVDDIDYVVPEIHRIGWPTRWADGVSNPALTLGAMTSPPTNAGGSPWKMADDYKSYRCDKPPEDDVAWLLYRHIVPTSTEWEQLNQGVLPPETVAVPMRRRLQAYESASPRLITDFNCYNAGLVRNRVYTSMIDARALITQNVNTNSTSHGVPDVNCYRDPLAMGANWCGDLVVEGTLQSRSPIGTVCFRLIKGGVDFCCTIELETGIATLSIPEVPQFQPVQTLIPTPMQGTGQWDFRFANVDEQLRLWIDNVEMEFVGGGEYDFLLDGDEPFLARNRSPKIQDTVPVGIGVHVADIEVSHLRVKRDIYYIAAAPGGRSPIEMDTVDPIPLRSEQEFAVFYSDPNRWWPLGKTLRLEFELGEDQFLMLGDNSAKSKDSRLWKTDTLPPYVPREAIVGRAISVYWPHGWPVPYTKQPFVPDFDKMRSIR